MSEQAVSAIYMLFSVKILHREIPCQSLSLLKVTPFRYVDRKKVFSQHRPRIPLFFGVYKVRFAPIHRAPSRSPPPEHRAHHPRRR